MKSLICQIFFCHFVWCSATATDRVIGGKPVTGRRYPSVVQIIKAESQTSLFGPFCTGSLLTPWHVLTAAHCFPEKFPEGTGVVAGTDKFVRFNGNPAVKVPTFGGVYSKIVESYCHPIWGMSYSSSDICIVKLESPIPTNVNISLVDLVDVRPGVGSLVHLVGFGSTGRYALSQLFTAPTSLMEVDSHIVDPKKAKFREFTDTVFISSGLEDTCQGDSGGPVYTLSGGKLKQLAIVSTGFGCGVGVAGVYTDVVPHLDWIENVIMTGSVGNGSCNCTDSELCATGYTCLPSAFTDGRICVFQPGVSVRGRSISRLKGLSVVDCDYECQKVNCSKYSHRASAGECSLYSGGSLVPDDGANAWECPVCGDGIRSIGEGCDDGNDAEGDGCFHCLVEKGFKCSGDRCYVSDGKVSLACYPAPPSNMSVGLGSTVNATTEEECRRECIRQRFDCGGYMFAASRCYVLMAWAGEAAGNDSIVLAEPAFICSVCGNGIVEFGENCDSFSPSCQFCQLGDRFVCDWGGCFEADRTCTRVAGILIQGPLTRVVPAVAAEDCHVKCQQSSSCGSYSYRANNCYLSQGLQLSYFTIAQGASSGICAPAAITRSRSCSLRNATVTAGLPAIVFVPQWECEKHCLYMPYCRYYNYTPELLKCEMYPSDTVVEFGASSGGSLWSCNDWCGNDEVTGNEECDDGNLMSGDGCDSSCKVEFGYKCSEHGCANCGNGKIDPLEDCDGGVGCSDCRAASGYSCYTTEDNEWGCWASTRKCDKRPTGYDVYGAAPSQTITDVSSDACEKFCKSDSICTAFKATTAACLIYRAPHVIVLKSSDPTSGILVAQCSGMKRSCFSSPNLTGDANAVISTFVSVPSLELCAQHCRAHALCKFYAYNTTTMACTTYRSALVSTGSIGQCADCGDGVTTGAEQCDDGNLADNDGCSSACKQEEGYNCTLGACVSRCGDGIVATYYEECDDGNTNSQDGCSASCALEANSRCNGTSCDTCHCEDIPCRQSFCVDGQCQYTNMLDGTTLCLLGVEVGYCMNGGCVKADPSCPEYCTPSHSCEQVACTGQGLGLDCLVQNSFSGSQCTYDGGKKGTCDGQCMGTSSCGCLESYCRPALCGVAPSGQLSCAQNETLALERYGTACSYDGIEGACGFDGCGLYQNIINCECDQSCGPMKCRGVFLGTSICVPLGDTQPWEGKVCPGNGICAYGFCNPDAFCRCESTYCYPVVCEDQNCVLDQANYSSVQGNSCTTEEGARGRCLCGVCNTDSQVSDSMLSSLLLAPFSILRVETPDNANLGTLSTGEYELAVGHGDSTIVLIVDGVDANITVSGGDSRFLVGSIYTESNSSLLLAFVEGTVSASVVLKAMYTNFTIGELVLRIRFITEANMTGSLVLTENGSRLQELKPGANVSVSGLYCVPEPNGIAYLRLDFELLGLQQTFTLLQTNANSTSQVSMMLPSALPNNSFGIIRAYCGDELGREVTCQQCSSGSLSITGQTTRPSKLDTTHSGAITSVLASCLLTTCDVGLVAQFGDALQKIQGSLTNNQYSQLVETAITGLSNTANALNESACDVSQGERVGTSAAKLLKTMKNSFDEMSILQTFLLMMSNLSSISAKCTPSLAKLGVQAVPSQLQTQWDLTSEFASALLRFGLVSVNSQFNSSAGCIRICVKRSARTSDIFCEGIQRTSTAQNSDQAYVAARYMNACQQERKLFKSKSDVSINIFSLRGSDGSAVVEKKFLPEAIDNFFIPMPVTPDLKCVQLVSGVVTDIVTVREGTLGCMTSSPGSVFLAAVSTPTPSPSPAPSPMPTPEPSPFPAVSTPLPLVDLPNTSSGLPSGAIVGIVVGSVVGALLLVSAFAYFFVQSTKASRLEASPTIRAEYSSYQPAYQKPREVLYQAQPIPAEYPELVYPPPVFTPLVHGPGFPSVYHAPNPPMQPSTIYI